MTIFGQMFVQLGSAADWIRLVFLDWDIATLQAVTYELREDLEINRKTLWKMQSKGRSHDELVAMRNRISRAENRLREGKSRLADLRDMRLDIETRRKLRRVSLGAT